MADEWKEPDPQPKRRRGRPTNKEAQEREKAKYAILTRPPIAVVELPYGYTVECFEEGDEDDVRRDLASYVERQALIPQDYWPHMQRLLVAMQQHRKVSREIVRLQSSPAADKELLQERTRWQEKLHRQIQEISAKFDILKQNVGNEEDAASILEMYKAEMAAYMEEHKGEFEWQCPHCQRFCICEVPHFAYDAAAGPKVIWNTEIYEQVKRYYDWRKRWENVVRGLPDNVRRALLEPHVQVVLAEAGGLSVIDAAAVLRMSPIGILAMAWEREYNLGFAFDLDKPLTLAPYVLPPEDVAPWVAEYTRNMGNTGNTGSQTDDKDGEKTNRNSAAEEPDEQH